MSTRRALPTWAVPLAVAVVLGAIYLFAPSGTDRTAGPTGFRATTTMARRSDASSRSTTVPSTTRSSSTKSTSTSKDFRSTPLSSLPREAAATWRLIETDGPFPYDRDGVVFSNFEGRLPRKPSGYYHEYTVPTPNVRSRGARRLIVGRNAEVFYTADHYDSFEPVDVER